MNSKLLTIAIAAALLTTACAVELPPPEAFAHQSANTAEDQCLQAPACIIGGACTADGAGHCVVAHDEDCALSKDCQQAGHCHLLKLPARTICAATIEQDCQQSTFCSTNKQCELVDNGCQEHIAN